MGFFKHALKSLNPMNAMKMLPNPLHPFQGMPDPRHPLQALQNGVQNGMQMATHPLRTAQNMANNPMARPDMMANALMSNPGNAQQQQLGYGAPMQPTTPPPGSIGAQLATGQPMPQSTLFGGVSGQAQPAPMQPMQPMQPAPQPTPQPAMARPGAPARTQAY